MFAKRFCFHNTECPTLPNAQICSKTDRDVQVGRQVEIVCRKPIVLHKTVRQKYGKFVLFYERFARSMTYSNDVL